MPGPKKIDAGSEGIGDPQMRQSPPKMRNWRRLHLLQQIYEGDDGPVKRQIAGDHPERATDIPGGMRPKRLEPDRPGGARQRLPAPCPAGRVGDLEAPCLR